MLLSAGLPLPTEILVHDYLTIDGQKISKSTIGKSGGATADPARLVEQSGRMRCGGGCWREVPRVGDADFTRGRLVERANGELAGEWGIWCIGRSR
jgi:methionyl-tRNA synthetase